MQPDSSASVAPALEVCGAVNYPVMLLLFQLMQMQPVSPIEPKFIISMLVSVTHSGQSNSDKSEAFEFILIIFFFNRNRSSLQRALLLLPNLRPKYKLVLGVAELGVLGFAMWVMLQPTNKRRWKSAA